MMTTIELTGAKFEGVDFSEAVLRFDIQRVLPQRVEIGVWGATVLTKRARPAPVPLQGVAFDALEEDTYVAAFSELAIEETKGGQIEVTPYERGSDKSMLVRCPDGQPLRLRRTWAETLIAQPVHEYGFDSVIEWPAGFCHLTLRAAGNVVLTLDTRNCIPVSEYIRDPKRYGFQLWHD